MSEQICEKRTQCLTCGKNLTRRQITCKRLYCSRACYFISNTGHEVKQSTRDKIAATKIGKKRSEETIHKMSESALQNYASGKVIHYQTGKPRTEEQRQKQSETLKKRYRSGELIHPMTGRKMSNEVIERVRRLKLGTTASIETRQKMSEAHIGGYWYGNVRYDDPKYCEKWTANLRERVRAYFGYKCFECGLPQTKRRLSIHHVHYNKKTCCDGSPHDMVPLCPECHSKTNFNRDYWEDHFVEKLYNLSPDGKCFLTQEEYQDYLKTP